ncbi:MAG TPA: zinc-binding dehydrogenase [Solirubrobacteraceae bacterium]|jgi:NADPH:quinone reductase-like Zn-dependent oxidoreductase|nr:zinc-binding dehydrogenase [Solirubrobacteraceae bacterium]
MRALVSASSPPHVELAEVPDPRPESHEALVEVKAFSLNRGEVRRLASAEPGSATGWDVAGVVRAPAADGSGPTRGARVVGMVQRGAWAELVAVPTDVLAELPEGVSFEQAATLPVAGVTAVRALEVGGFILGKSVLVTGASGGVGHFAIQLAKLAGARVTALARRTEGLAELGADEVISELEPEGPTFEVIVDAVGGSILGAAIGRIVPGGTIVNFASTTDEPVSYPTAALFRRAPGARLYGLYVFTEVARRGTGSSDLRRLAELVAAGRLDPLIDIVAPWTEVGSVIEALLDRRVRGKAVLTVA